MGYSLYEKLAEKILIIYRRRVDESIATLNTFIEINKNMSIVTVCCTNGSIQVKTRVLSLNSC